VLTGARGIVIELMRPNPNSHKEGNGQLSTRQYSKVALENMDYHSVRTHIVPETSGWPSVNMPVALSIRQPWTELILQGHKTIEVRGWLTQYRGELYLHAGKRPDREALDRFALANEDLCYGALVGKCELSDCILFTTDSWDSLRHQHLNKGPLREPKYAWFLRNPVRIQPRPFKGRLGLIRLDTSLIERRG